MKRFIIMLALVCLLPLSAQAATVGQERANIQRMRDDVLARLYAAQPGAQSEISHAVGYAVFSSADVAVIFFSGGLGHGIAHDNTSGQDTYMRVASAGAGLGIGVKDFRAVFVFDNAKSFHDFVSTGLDLSGHADVAVKQGPNGGAITGAEDVLPGVRVYQLTDTGLMAQAMLKGTKYWQDDELNGGDGDSMADMHAAPTSGTADRSNASRGFNQ